MNVTALRDVVPDPRDAVVALGFVVVVNAIGSSPTLVADSDTGWIDRPWFFPPEAAFPIAWTLLFTLMGIALYLVWQQGIGRRDVQLAFGAFAVQFALNLVWTPAFFGLQRPDYGLAIILALWVAIVATIAAFDRVDRRAALLLVPYLAWVTFATVLNYSIYVSWA